MPDVDPYVERWIGVLRDRSHKMQGSIEAHRLLLEQLRADLDRANEERGKLKDGLAEISTMLHQMRTADEIAATVARAVKDDRAERAKLIRGRFTTFEKVLAACLAIATASLSLLAALQHLLP